MKAPIVLKALQMGIKVEGLLEWCRVVMRDGEICMEARSSERGQVFLPIDLTLSHFVDACENMADEDFAIVVSNLTLNEQKETRLCPASSKSQSADSADLPENPGD